MDRLDSMRVFARVVQEGSFVGAARDLNLSPAVVTRTVAALEEHLGARLLNRTTRRLALTDTGEAYLQRVRQILADVDEAEALAGTATSEPRGLLRVVSPPAFASHQLAKHLPRFRALYPRVKIELSVPGPVETIDDAADVSLIQVIRPLEGGDFVARLLAHSEVIACASPEYLDRCGRPTDPGSFGDHDALVPPSVRELTLVKSRSPQGRAGRDRSTATTLRINQAALASGHIDTLHAAALAGMGIAGLPSFLIEDDLRSGRLERVLPDWHMLTSYLYAAVPTRKHVPARTRGFVDFLVDAFGGAAVDPWLGSTEPR
ncbi:MAG: LysR family transcriptional regulator [Lautropia sp.]